MGFSFFFRDVDAMDMIIEHALPEIKNNRYISIWSAGCSEGQEPYTLAIKLRENVGPFTFRKIKIYATDVDNTTGEFGNTIHNAVYPKEMIKRVDSEILSKYFRPVGIGAEYKLVDEIKRAVEFQQHDLLSYREIRSSINVILCKNVLMHFNSNQRVGVIRMFHQALAPGGFLVLERTQEMPREVSYLFTRVTDRGQVFRKK